MALRPSPNSEPVPFSDLMGSVLRGLKPPKADHIQAVRVAWLEVAGEAVARRTRILACEKGQLRIAVESAAMKYHLQTFRGPDLLDGLRARMPGVVLDTIRYHIGVVS